MQRDSAPRTAHTVDALVVGGGFFGAWLALDLARRGLSVVLLERERELLQRASLKNQARVHNGYHYPRSILTGLRSRVNSERFLNEFEDCVDQSFSMYYAVARRLSNVTAAQFKQFCARIGAPLAPAPRAIRDLFDPAAVEDVFTAEEWAFDAVKLAARLRSALARERVDVRTGCEALAFEPGTAQAGRIATRARVLSTGEELIFASEHAFNCTYASLNDVLARSGIEKLALKIEHTEIVLVDVPEPLKNVGVTVMCGPFFSVMPFPSNGLHTLSHVRYTPHAAWQDRESDEANQARFERLPRRSNAAFMLKDAERYLPLASKFEVRDSFFELKAVLPQSEADDSRPILFKRDAGLAGLNCVLGGKIDNVYDMSRELDSLLAVRGLTR
ncbi:MAG: FAD-dependent oxidoreductase [Planctomycetes bacterium]|nr:FAD-dependent oxidoreductase [Planctomycetota bacterium]